jgi:DNA-binding transcriptional ArsR family regulator
VDDVFRALADPTRRALLDSLYERDGQTLVSLTAHHGMTRIGVAKHLRLLEDAGLVVTRRRGREKLHFLNAIPIQLVHDRWVDKYAERWARRPHGPQARIGAADGEGVRDLHPDDAGAPVGGDHGSSHPVEVPLRRERAVRLGARLALRAAASELGWTARRGREPRRRPAAEARAAR